MNKKQMLKLVLNNIYQNKFRAFLTTLGVIVGTATIFLVIAIGMGGEKQVADQFSSLSPETIIVSAAARGQVIDPLTAADADNLASSPYISEAIPILQRSFTISYGSYSESGMVVGSLPILFENNGLIPEYGRLLDEDDNSRKKSYVVLGNELADTYSLGDNASLLGKQFTINSRKYEVIGILKASGNSSMNLSYDNAAYIPYENGLRLLFGKNSSPTINVLAKDINSVSLAMEDINSILEETHRNAGNAFRVTNAGSRLTAAQESAKTMSSLLLGVAVIVLIVSGIGIMNVMFVTVKERTKEIGTLKALGAKKKEILEQFLLEAIFISLFGGITGVFIGAVLMPLMEKFDIPVAFSINSIIFGLFFSVATGVFFGYYPAFKASELDKIDELRYE
jgi:putative ABC transport system permease protein